MPTIGDDAPYRGGAPPTDELTQRQRLAHAVPVHHPDPDQAGGDGVVSALCPAIPGYSMAVVRLLAFLLLAVVAGIAARVEQL